MKHPTPEYAIGKPVRVLLKNGGNYCGIIVQCHYNGAQQDYRYQIIPDGINNEHKFKYAWEYDMCPMFSIRWPAMVEAVIKEMVAL